MLKNLRLNNLPSIRPLASTVASLAHNDLFLGIFGAVIDTILEHANSVEGNDKYVDQSKRIVHSVKGVVKKLEDNEARFPSAEDCQPLINLVETLASLLEALQKWSKKSTLKKWVGLSRSGTTQASKYRRRFEDLFQRLDRDVQLLILRNTANTQVDTSEIKELLGEANQQEQHAIEVRNTLTNFTFATERAVNVPVRSSHGRTPCYFV